MKLLRKIYNRIRLDRPDPSLVPAEYLTRRGTVKNLSLDEVFKLIEEDMELYHYLEPFIDQKRERKQKWDFSLCFSYFSLVFAIGCFIYVLIKVMHRV